jgi:hypothetical protein
MRVNYIPRLSLNPPPVPCRNPGSRAKTDRNSRAVGCERTRSRPGPFRVASGLLCACHRHYSGRFDGACLLVYPDRQRPSRCDSPVGSCNCSFGACSAFTRVRASTLVESPGDPLLRKLQTARCLTCRFNGCRVERTSSRAGATPAGGFGIASKGRSSGFHGALWRQQSALPAMLLGAVSARTSRET